MFKKHTTKFFVTLINTSSNKWLVITISHICHITFLHKSSFKSNHQQQHYHFYYYNNTPIKHLVVIVQEDISFDHYFGTYPNATNPPGEPHFSASPNTPSINGLNSSLLYQNPNSANPITP